MFRLDKCKKIFMCEVHVLEKLLERALADNKQKTDLLRQFAFVLKVPRMHHEYIQRNGIDPFIEKFTQLISENATLKKELDRIDENRMVRKAVSLIKNDARSKKQSRLDGTLPMQVELIIS